MSYDDRPPWIPYQEHTINVNDHQSLFDEAIRLYGHITNRDLKVYTCLRFILNQNTGLSPAEICSTIEGMI